MTSSNSFATSHAGHDVERNRMDDHELRQLRVECVNELKSFVSFFNIGGVDHTHGGFCCGLSHAGKRLTDQKFVWFNGRGLPPLRRRRRSTGSRISRRASR